jgi:cardiolipin synthase
VAQSPGTAEPAAQKQTKLPMSLTPANQITIMRLLFAPLFGFLISDRHYSAALLVLLLAAASDAVDGTVARRFHQESPLGIALDPIADKVLLTTAYLMLALVGALPWWITIVVLSRDAGILITALLIILFSGYRSFRPSTLGKASTAVQVLTVFAAVGLKANIPLISPGLLTGLIYATAALALASGLDYLMRARNFDSTA